MYSGKFSAGVIILYLAVCVLPWTSVATLIYIVDFFKEGLFGFIKYLISLLPIWMLLAGYIWGKSRGRHNRYCITTEGIYLKIGDGKTEQRIFAPYRRLEDVTCSTEGLPKKYGIVNCRQRKPTSDPNDSLSQYDYFIRLQCIRNYQIVASFIREQIEMTEKNGTAFEQAGVYPVRTDIPPEPSEQDKTPESPQQSFYAAPEQPEYAAIRNDFLDQTMIGAAEYLEQLPQESVSDLQTELFGTNAKRSGTFPDPTVNPLPEWKAPGDSFFGQTEPEDSGAVPDSSAREQGAQGTFYQQGN